MYSSRRNVFGDYIHQCCNRIPKVFEPSWDDPLAQNCQWCKADREIAQLTLIKERLLEKIQEIDSELSEIHTKLNMML